MYDVIMEAVTKGYILWGIGLLGLLLRMMFNGYMKSMVKASENMATTKKKNLRIMKQKYENGKSLGLHRGTGEAFVEKNVRKFRFVAIPLEMWRRSSRFLCILVTMFMAGSLLYYEISWRGSPDMITFMANGFLVCAFLIGIENIFLINNKMEILKANIRDYLENIPVPRQQLACGAEGLRQVKRDSLKTEVVGDVLGNEKYNQGIRESAAADIEEMENPNEISPKPPDNEEALNSFLREFFS